MTEHKSIIKIYNHTIRENNLTVIAGPCSIESEQQINDIASSVATAGANILRGGAVKPRTSPHSFQGIGHHGYKMLHQAARANNMACIAEVIDDSSLYAALDWIDIIQIGARNMQNYSLLTAVGKAKKPVLLKRGFAATYKELLAAAEYILEAGNPHIILCERGIRTFEPTTRNTLDIAAIPMLQQQSHLAVFVDPSHGTGLRNIVPPMSLAAVAAGANGLMLEVHSNPDKSISDAAQTISTTTFALLMSQIRKLLTLNDKVSVSN